MLDELFEKRPKTAEGALASIRAYLEDEMVVAKIPPVQGKPKYVSKAARVSR